MGPNSGWQRFQSTPPRRRRHRILNKISRDLLFQSTPPRRRRPVVLFVVLQFLLFQSTPPRRRRRTFHSLFVPANVISIHASEKEATGWWVTLERQHRISIHASEKEATLKKPDWWWNNYFNPRLREGGDCSDWFSNLLTHDFNPRLREGGDCNILWYLNYHVHI